MLKAMILMKQDFYRPFLEYVYSHSIFYFFLNCCFVVPVTDPEQNVQELVYDLRSQCDAIRVTKTVRPYRVVICPVNENSAALVVSDGRVMLWELKAHPSKSSSNLRYNFFKHNKVLNMKMVGFSVSH